MSSFEEAIEMFRRYAASRGSRPEPPSYSMYVGNISWDMDDDDLKQVFSEHGKVVSARIIYDRETGQSRGFGFVSMSSKSEMHCAIRNLDGQCIDGRSMRVKVGEDRP